MNAKTGARGVSKVLKRAVWPDGTRLAPSANVTDAMANSSPNAERTKSYVRSISNGLPNIAAKGSKRTDDSTAGPAPGVSGYFR